MTGDLTTGGWHAAGTRPLRIDSTDPANAATDELAAA